MKRCRRCSAPRCSCVRQAAPTPACMPPARWPMSTCPPTRSRTPIRAHRDRGIREFLPLVRTAGAASAGRCPSARHRPGASGFRRTVLGAAAPLRVPAVDGPARCRAAAGALRDGVAAPAGRRCDGGRIARTGRAARLRRVLPTSGGCHHDPRPAAAGLVAVRRPRHRLRHRRRVLLVDGALAGRRAAGSRGGPPRTGWCADLLTAIAPLQRIRGRPAAGPDARRRGLPARRPTRGAHHGDPRPASPRRLEPERRDEVGGLIHHARVDVSLGERGRASSSPTCWGRRGCRSDRRRGTTRWSARSRAG